MQIKKGTILIIGGAGFIGSNLTEHFLKKGYKVRVLDNFATGHMHNLLPFFESYPDSFQPKVGDIRNLNDYQEACHGVKYVIHEAAHGSVPRSIKIRKEQTT